MTTMVRDLTKKTPNPTAADENSTASADARLVSDHPPYSESGSDRDEFDEESGHDGENDPDGDSFLSFSNPPLDTANWHKGDTGADAILNRDYAGEAPHPTLPPVSEKLAKVVSSWLRVTPAREKIKDLFKNTLYPSNVEGLEPVRINDMLYQSLPFTAKVADQRLRGINTYFTRGIGPLINVLDTLISLESFLTRDKPPSIQIEGQRLVVDDTKFDISQLRLWVDGSLRILSTGNAVTLMKRRTAIKAFLDPQYHHLLKMSNPITSELLGPNLDQKVSELNKIHDVAKKLHFKRRNRGGSTAGRKFHQDNRSQF